MPSPGRPGGMVDRIQVRYQLSYAVTAAAGLGAGRSGLIGPAQPADREQQRHRIGLRPHHGRLCVIFAFAGPAFGAQQ